MIETTFSVTNFGEPVSGVTIVVGEMDVVKTTDENGQIVANLDENFHRVLDLYISCSLGNYYATLVIQAGGSYEIKLETPTE